MANKFFPRCVWLRWTAWRYPASFVTQNRRIHFWSKKRQRKSWSNKRRPRRQLKHERELNVISPESLDKPREDVWLNRQKEWRWFALFRFETSTPAAPPPPLIHIHSSMIFKNTWLIWKNNILATKFCTKLAKRNYIRNLDGPNIGK